MLNIVGKTQIPTAALGGVAVGGLNVE